MIVWPHTGEIQKIHSRSKFDRFRSTFTRDTEYEVSTNLLTYRSTNINSSYYELITFTGVAI